MVQRSLSFRRDAVGNLVLTDQQTGILLRPDGLGNLVPSDDTSRAPGARMTHTPSGLQVY